MGNSRTKDRRNIFQKAANIIGLDHLGEKYSYGTDERFGFMAGEKVPEKWVKTTCGYCSVGCGILLGVKDGEAVSLKGDPDHAVNYGKLCPKGHSEHYSISAPDRALYPMVRNRQSDRFSRVSWNEALNALTSQFAHIQEQYGPESLGVISTGQLLTEEFYTLGKLVQLGFGTNNYDGNTTLCMATAVVGYKRSFGSDGPPGAYEDLAIADCVILIGANIADNHPILTCWVNANENPEKKLIVVDPRATKTAMMADIFLPLKPRTDVALLNGMAHIIIREKLYDAEYIARHTSGFLAMVEGLNKFTPEYTASITGLPVEQIIESARAYGNSRAGFIAWTMGVNHSDQGTETVNAINNLALLTGRVGRPGSSPFSITGQCNAMGSRESSFTSSLPGYRKFESAEDRKDLAALWAIDEARIPDARGLAYPDIIEAIVQGKIKALWIIATNPLVSYPNRAFLEEALSRLEFLVVQDGYHPTPTTRWADLVLPAAVWGEKEGTYTNSERRVSKANAAVQPPGEAKPDFDIFLEIARKLGVKDEIYPGWYRPLHAFEEWKNISRGRLCDYSGMDFDLIEKVGGIQWPFPAQVVAGLSPEERENEARKTRRLYTDGVFQTADGRAKFFTLDNRPMPEEPTEKFPLILNTGRTVEHWHTRTKTGKIEILEKISPEAWVEMNPVDARELNLVQGEKIRVLSRRGRIDEITLRITEIVQIGQIFIPFHWFETSANNLTLNAFDPISREPNYKQCAVRVEKPGVMETH